MTWMPEYPLWSSWPKMARQGWQCPVCNRVYSPDTLLCFYCGNQNVKVAQNTTGTESLPKEGKE